jgi:hypothetical protein
MNYRGKAAISEENVVSECVSLFNKLTTRGRFNFMKKFRQNKMGTQEWYDAYSIYTDVDDEPHLAAFDTTSIHGLKTYSSDFGKTTTQKKFEQVFSQQVAISKSLDWNLGMNWPIRFARLSSQIFSRTMFTATMLKTTMVGLSNEFFLKYAYHIESHRNVWDIQYKSTDLADWYNVDSDLRLPYPVVWLEAPDKGYILNPPKKKLDDRIQKQSRKDNWTPLHNQPIGGILVIEADMIPVENTIPDKGKEKLLLKNMIWQIPDTRYTMFNERGTQQIIGDTHIGERRKPPYDKYVTDIEIQQLFNNEIKIIEKFQRDPWDIPALKNTDGPMAKQKGSSTNHNMRFIQQTNTSSLPMNWIECHEKWKSGLANEIWDIGACKPSNIMGLYGVPEIHKLKNKEEIPNELAYYQRCFLRVLYDGEAEKFVVKDLADDEYANHPTYHLNIPNFPKEGVSTQGILAPEALLSLGSKPTLESSEVGGVHHKQCETYNHLPAFMVTGFNNKCFRTATPMQQWLADIPPQVIESANITKNMPKTREGKRRAWDTNFAERERVILGEQMGFKSKGMTLDYQSKNLLLDDMGIRQDILNYLPLEQKNTEHTRSLEMLTLENLTSGLHYGFSDYYQRKIINRHIERISRYNLPIEDYFPEYNEKKHESVTLFLDEKKKELLSREQAKLLDIANQNEECAGHQHPLIMEMQTPYIRNTLIREKKWSHVPYDIYGAINEHSVRAKRDEAFFVSKWFIEEKGFTQHPFFKTKKVPTANESIDELRERFVFPSHSPFSWGETSPVLTRHLLVSATTSMDWHTNRAKKPRKFMIATVFDVEGHEIMRIPIPSHMQTVGELMRFYDALWRIPKMTMSEFAENMMNAWDREDDTIRPLSVKNRVFVQHERYDGTEGVIYEHAALVHFTKEIVSLLLGIGNFLNKPDVHTIETPFALRRGARRRDGTFHTERIDTNEHPLMTKNRRLKMTGIVKKYSEMSPITNSRGKINKRFQVRRHPRQQPYPSRGTVEQIWIEPYWKGEGKNAGRVIIELQDKRGDDNA